MDHIHAKDKETELNLDLERGLEVTLDNSKNEFGQFAAEQEKSYFDKVSDGFIGSSITQEGRPNLNCNEPSVSGVYVVVGDATNKLTVVQNSVNVKKTLVKEKRKKAGNKKASKPPRPPRSLQAEPLDAADQKLVRELSELALLKRARIERMKALQKMRASKPSSSNSSIIATVFTVVFCIVMLVQGLSSGNSSVAAFQGSPLPTTRAEGAWIPSQHSVNPSAHYSNAPRSESHNKFVEQFSSSNLSEKLRRAD